MLVTWKEYLTPGAVTAGFGLVCAVLVYLLNHKSGMYKDELTVSMNKGFAVQTAAIVKTQVECKDEIVAAIKESK